MNKSRFLLIILLPLLLSCGTGTTSSLSNSGLNKSRKIEFKVKGRLRAWDIRSVTYVGEKNTGCIMLIKGVATMDYPDKLNGIVKAGYFTKKNEERFSSSYIFPAVKRGESFELYIQFFLPANHDLTTIGGLLFEDGIDSVK